jgi:hypothetical protein
MANNEEQIGILAQGIDIWNQWRQEHSDIIPDLRGMLVPLVTKLRMADFSRADLRGVPFIAADLSEADFRYANLTDANLMGANLNNADFRGANLMTADLDHANLTGADLMGANLMGANLREATLRGATLVLTHLNILSQADLTNALLGNTTFSDVDLSEVKGLETIKHLLPSTIGIDTIYKSKGNIPAAFLRGAGVSENFITYMHSLTGEAFKFYSCFICYSSKDTAFVERLYADLQSKEVRCWYASRDMRIGSPILTEIDSAISRHDKLLLILSENSVRSRWVEHEVLAATTKEFQQDRKGRVLFPIRLDDSVMEIHDSWVNSVRTRHIGDFTKWKDHDSYQKAFDRLLRDLKAGE